MAVAVAAARDEHGQPRFSVVGVDLPTALGQERIDCLNGGRFPFRTSDNDLVDATAQAHAAGNLLASSDPRCFVAADVILVDVHLDVDTSNDAAAVDFAPFRAAIHTIGAHMKPGALVIVETTVPPGSCERVVAPALAATLRERGLPADAFLLAHSYERVMPGERYLASITNFWRVYAGHTPAAADACERFLTQVINVHDYPLTRLASTTASEMAKVVENSYRATTIAFVEEWARFAETVGVDFFTIVEAIRVRPTHNNMRQPGFGVGGYCLTKDPLFGGIATRQLFERPDLLFPFSEMAVSTNRRMPIVSVDRLQELLGGDLQGRRVALLGVAYRPDVADTRYSPSQTFVEEAEKRGAQIVAHDPLVARWPETKIAVSAELPAADGLDAVVLAVPHRAYQSVDFAGWLRHRRPVVLDANGVLSEPQRRALTDVGCRVASIGRGW